MKLRSIIYLILFYFLIKIKISYNYLFFKNLNLYILEKKNYFKHKYNKYFFNFIRISSQYLFIIIIIFYYLF